MRPLVGVVVLAFLVHATFYRHGFSGWRKKGVYSTRTWRELVSYNIFFFSPRI